MRIPFNVSAAASAGICLSRGYIDPALAMPVTLRVLAIGAKLICDGLTGRIQGSAA